MITFVKSATKWGVRAGLGKIEDPHHRAQFEAEPTAYRWIFYREGVDTWTRVLELRHGSDHDNKGIEIWSSQLGIDQLAHTLTRCFDEVAQTYGESGYRDKWGEHFPRTELEALRRLWHARHRSDDAYPQRPAAQVE